MQRFLKVQLLLVAIATTAVAAGPDEAGVKGVIQQFQQALERRDVGAMEVLVSPWWSWRTDSATGDGWIFVTIT